MNDNKRWVKGTGLVILEVDKAPPTAPIPGQVLREVKFMQVTFNVFLPRSPRSSSTSLAFHYDSFDPSYWGVMGLSLDTPKPSQPVLPHLCGERCDPYLLPELLVSYPIHRGITTQYTSTLAYAFLLLLFYVQKSFLKVNILCRIA